MGPRVAPGLASGDVVEGGRRDGGGGHRGKEAHDERHSGDQPAPPTLRAKDSERNLRQHLDMANLLGVRVLCNDHSGGDCEAGVVECLVS